MSVSGTHGPGCPCPYCASYSDPMADFVTVKVNKKEYERLKEENKALHSTAIVDAARVENAEGLVTELRAEVERLTAEVTDLREGNQVAANTLAPLIGERDRYKAALERIAEPVWWMQEDQLRATGSINGLDGAAAVALAKDPEYLKGIAKEALAEAVRP